jgi:hypothetical protein
LLVHAPPDVVDIVVTMPVVPELEDVDAGPDVDVDIDVDCDADPDVIVVLDVEPSLSCLPVPVSSAAPPEDEFPNSGLAIPDAGSTRHPGSMTSIATDQGMGRRSDTALLPTRSCAKAGLVRSPAIEGRLPPRGSPGPRDFARSFIYVLIC